jgi:hypothetical protein
VRKLNKIEDIIRKQRALDKIKSEETNKLLKNGQDNKNRCDAMDGITYVSVDLVTHNVC